MKQLLLLLLIGIWFNNVCAQNSDLEVISTTGESYQSNSIQIDWTLGELVVTTIQNSKQQITQGFHQPYYTISDISELPVDFGKIIVFPNPTSDEINMILKFKMKRNVLIQLVDLEGKIISSEEIIGQIIEENINLKLLPVGNYFLNFLIDKNEYSQTFIIQKSL